MRWPAVLITLSFSLGLPAILASACGTPGLGVSGNPNTGGASSSGTGTATGNPTATGPGGGGSSGTSLFDGSFGGGFNQDSGGLGVCVPQTCTEIGATCGQQGDGCGNVIDCGGCQLPQTCGGGGIHNACGGTNTCIQRTCADAMANCGPVSDGCGGLLQCGSCTSPETCGGGGTASQCGGDSGCIATTCAQQGISCGPAGDGCGGLLQCGSCTAPETCGGGGTPGVCGQTIVDAGSGNMCIPRTCMQQGINCGPAGDGCGGLLQCGVCASPETCGGGGMPGVCGGNSGCAAKTCADLGFNCGPAGDGCGGELMCGSCTAPQTCGGGGTPGVCGGFNNCVPKTCASLGMNCGPAGDGCGGLLQCGNSCPAGQICGGGGQPGVCGPADAGAVNMCTGLCLQQVTCPGKNVTTTISGTVFAPNGADPIYNALVYVPNAPVAAFTPGVACDQCGDSVSGSPLVSATTAPDGTFQLQNVPVGSNIPVVVQLGRWRRQFVIPTVTACVNNVPGPSPFFTLPKNKSQGDIPLIAMVTGSADGLECVLRLIGIDDAEFTDPSGTGRIHWFVSNGANSSTNDAPNVSQLFSSQATLNAYDMVILACNGTPAVPPNDVSMSTEDMLKAYTTAGGRVFATHFSYAWLYNYSPFSGTATWQVAQPDPGNVTGLVDFTNPKGQAFAQWSMVVGASTAYGQVGPITQVRRDFDAVNAMEAQQWLYWNNAGTPVPLHYTFNTAVGVPAAQQCGRILFSDFHVAQGSGGTFPQECTTTTLDAQEHLLEFMLFDLASCITPLVPPPPPTCTPQTCAQLGFNCGPAGDGCGGLLACGACTPPQTCGGGGMPGVCGGMPCSSMSCAAQGIQCGPAGDGCGNLLQCGNCPNGQTCGGGGQPGKCGTPVCNPTTCAAQGIQCGPAGNGCGGLLECGSCPPGQICGGVQPGKCSASDAGACAPITCAAQGIQCGPAGDGCGGQLDCGMCPPPQTCGGGGQLGKCGAPQCTTVTCADLGVQCGPAGDGCGGVQQCGMCPPNETCGGGGMPGICGSGCMPTTCSDLGFNCGPAGDGCGGLLQCGTCSPPDTCGGGGTPGKCGHFGTN
jgi:hypothetical protein